MMKQYIKGTKVKGAELGNEGGNVRNGKIDLRKGRPENSAFTFHHSRHNSFPMVRDQQI